MEDNQATETATKNPHVYYHPFTNMLMEKFGEDWTGYDVMEAIDEYVKDHPEIKIVRCDDEYFSGSFLVLVPHPKMGITVHFIPQLTKNTGNFFLYPEHQTALIKAIQELRQSHKTSKTIYDK